MQLKNISKLYAVAMILSGCISRETVTKQYEYEVKQSDGSIKKEKAGYATTELQFTYLGNIWNGAFYGVVGCGYGAYLRCEEEIINTNNIPVIGHVAKGFLGISLGSLEGLYKGTKRGVTLKYGEGPTLDDIVADQIQETAARMKNWANRYIGE